MNMESRTLAIVVLPENTRIIEADVAGQLARERMLGMLEERGDLEVRILDRLGAQDLDGRGLLIVDVRAACSSSAIANLFLRIKRSDADFQVIDAGRTLAVYLHPRRKWPNPFRGQRTVEAQGLEYILDPKSLSDATVIGSSELDRSEAALLLDTLADVAEFERRIMFERATLAMAKGVRIRDPRAIYIRGELVCGSRVEIDIGVLIEGRVELGNGVSVGAHSILRNASIGEGARIHPFSLVEDASVGSHGFIGPYARVRPGSVIGDRVQIGNYVEIKNSRIGDGGRINHHTFIGDAVLAEQVTIGAGTITCNHDGTGTNQTLIERGAYVGSGCNLVAPLRIGEQAVVGAGSTVTRDVPAAKLTLARSRQTTIENWRGPRSRREKK